VAGITIRRDPIAGGTNVHGAADIGDLVAGKTLKMETSPGGGEYLSERIPDGKRWCDVTISITAREVDA
jgi:hypothetical protein